MLKDMKIKHSVSSPLPSTKYGGNLLQKIFPCRKKHFGQIYGGMFYMETNDQIMQGRNLMVKRFQRLSQVRFSLTDLDLGYWYIIWKVNTTNRWLNLKKKHLLQIMLLGLGFHVKSLSPFLKNFGGDLFFDVLIIGLLIYIFMGQTHSQSKGS